jgi:hypothetical protein
MGAGRRRHGGEGRVPSREPRGPPQVHYTPAVTDAASTTALRPANCLRPAHLDAGGYHAAAGASAAAAAQLHPVHAARRREDKHAVSGPERCRDDLLRRPRRVHLPMA